MSDMDVYQILIYCFFLVVLVKPLGWYMAQVYEGRFFRKDKLIAPIERFIYRCCQIQPKQEMNWKHYLASMLIFNLIGFLIVYAILRLQIYLPLNPQALPNNTSDLAFNTSISFITNTNWQAYSGETAMSYFTQMLALTVQNFISAATGMSLLIALIRGLISHERSHLGSFWVDTVRGTLYILLPLSIFLALVLSSQGVIQSMKANQKVSLLQTNQYQQPKLDAAGQPINGSDGKPLSETITLTEQIIPMGPVASQVAIKQLGTNGGGFFNTNSAHPFENPNPFTNFLEMLAILLIPAALCYTFGCMIRDKRQGWALLIVMFIILIPSIFAVSFLESQVNPAFAKLGVDQTHQPYLSSGGNMEGKETRFGIVSSAIWTTATTAASNGSVNSMLDSYTPLGGFFALMMMHLNEVIFGGVGSGLYGMLLIVIVTVFVAGLMVGRTPEYLGKKIEPFEMKMAALSVLIMPLVVLLSTAIACLSKGALSSLANPGAHGFSELLYAFTSMGNNNGSAFAGLNANTPFYNILGGVVMLISRYWIAIPALAVAGSMAKKKRIPNSSGTLMTHTPLFIVLLISVILIFGALSFIPTLALGPIIEYILMGVHYGH